MKYDNLGLVAIMSIGFLTLFTAFNVCQNFATKILKDDGFDNIGFTSLAVLYLFFALLSLVSTPIVQRFKSTSFCMSAASLFYCAWIFSFLLPSIYSQKIDSGEELPWYLNRSIIVAAIISGSAMCGMGAAILWVS